jgi:peptidoglycan hydrolase CwlO-like protein
MTEEKEATKGGRKVAKILAVFFVSLSIVVFHAAVLHASYSQQKEMLKADVASYAARKEELASQQQSLQAFASDLRKIINEETARNEKLAQELSALTDQQVSIPAAPPVTNTTPPTPTPPRVTRAS